MVTRMVMSYKLELMILKKLGEKSQKYQEKSYTKTKI